MAMVTLNGFEDQSGLNSQVMARQLEVINHYYSNNYIASVTISPDGEVVPETTECRKALQKARRETVVCYVRRLDTKEGIKLRLSGRKWVFDVQ